MLILIYIVIPLMQMLEEDEISGDFDTPTKPSLILSTITYEPYDFPSIHTCENDEYEINVHMSDKLFAGTDDKVEIRLYGSHNETTQWFELDGPYHDGLERLSHDIYCIKADKHFKILQEIGIRKFGTDSLMIDEILIWHSLFGPLSGAVFPVYRWINEDTKEYIFAVSHDY